jgi:hypothetical protein
MTLLQQNNLNGKNKYYILTGLTISFKVILYYCGVYQSSFMRICHGEPRE